MSASGFEAPAPHRGAAATLHYIGARPPAALETTLSELRLAVALHRDVPSALQSARDGDLVVADLAKVAGPELDQVTRAHQPPQRCAVLGLCGRLAPAELAAVLSRGLGHLISTEPELDVRELRATLAKLQGGELFGLAHYFRPGVSVRRLELRSFAEIDSVGAEAMRLAESTGLPSSLALMFRTAADEMLTNAVFNAPVDAQGARRFAHLHRGVRVVLKPGEFARVELAADEDRVAISVADPFGSLDEGATIRQLCSHLTTRQRVVATRSGGAGLGLAIILDSVTHLVINLAPGTTTEVIGILHADPSRRAVLSRGKSVNLFRAGQRGLAPPSG